MPRFRVDHPSQALLVGPSPASGYSFVDKDNGTLSNGFEDLLGNHNLLMYINRVQSISYDLNTERVNILGLGDRGLISDPNLNPPSIKLGFDYLLNGIMNEMRIGLTCNYAQYQTGLSGLPYYSNNFNVNILSGLMARQFTQPTIDPFWPLPIRDNRNIYLVTSPEGDDIVHIKLSASGSDTTQGIDPKSTGYQVLAFGQCYLDSYRTECSVGNFPRASTSWTCENAYFCTSGSGFRNPAINTQTRQMIGTQKLVIPEIREEGGAYILNPGDILLSFTSSGDNLTGIGIQFQNIFVENYSIEFNLNREPLDSMGHKIPLDRQISFPIFVESNFGVIVRETESGSFIDRINVDSGYNVRLRLRNPLQCSPFHATQATHPKFDGPTSEEGQTAVMYDFWNSKLMGINYSTSIGQNKKANLRFRTEINPDNLTKGGFFISGLMNIERIADYWVDDTGNYILDHNNDLVFVNNRPLF